MNTVIFPLNHETNTRATFRGILYEKEANEFVAIAFCFIFKDSVFQTISIEWGGEKETPKFFFCERDYRKLYRNKTFFDTHTYI